MIKINEINASVCLNMLYECKIKYENLLKSETTEGMYEELVISIDKAINEMVVQYDKEADGVNLMKSKDIFKSVDKYMNNRN